MTCHGINKNLQRKYYVLSVSEFEGTNSGERIAEKLRQMLNNWGLSTEKAFLFVRDGAKNYAKVGY